jgi:hypothetical protein
MAGPISSTDVHKIQRHNVDDMISDLPEGVLLHILSFVPTKDAIRTSILAKKWKHLWTYLSVFHFEIVHPRYEPKKQNQNNTPNCLLDLVERLMHKSTRVERLGVRIFSTNVDTDKVSSIISSAANHKVQYLNLSLGALNDKFVLPIPRSFSAFESLNELCLGLQFTLHIPSGICFPSLKKLVISYVTFANENSVQQLFSGCPVLQELRLYKCYWENINRISVSISTLRNLTIYFDAPCVGYDHDMTLTIDAVNLLSLSCTSNPTIEYIPVNLTSLDFALIDIGHDFSHGEPYAAQCAIELLMGLSSVKSLKLYNNILEVCLTLFSSSSIIFF